MILSVLIEDYSNYHNGKNYSAFRILARCVGFIAKGCNPLQSSTRIFQSAKQ